MAHSCPSDTNMNGILNTHALCWRISNLLIEPIASCFAVPMLPTICWNPNKSKQWTRFWFVHWPENFLFPKQYFIFLEHFVSHCNVCLSFSLVLEVLVDPFEFHMWYYVAVCKHIISITIFAMPIARYGLYMFRFNIHKALNILSLRNDEGLNFTFMVPLCSQNVVSC